MFDLKNFAGWKKL